MISPLTKLLLEKKLTLKQVCEATEISRATLYRIEHGITSRVYYKTLVKFCQYFDYDPEQFKLEYSNYVNSLNQK